MFKARSLSQVAALLVFTLTALDGLAQPPPPLPGNQRFAVPQPTAAPSTPIPRPPPRKPLPRKYVIAAAALAAFVCVFMLSRALHRWHSSNLFNRAYKFPVSPTAGFRLGARRSGGQLARIDFKKSNRG